MTHVTLCQPRFVPAILAGDKLSTIRLERKRKIAVGDTLDLRQWTGKPYRSKQAKVRMVTVTRVCPVDIVRGILDEERVYCCLRGEPLSVMHAEALARTDGFESFQEMVNWFNLVHGLPFAGVLIGWAP